MLLQPLSTYKINALWGIVVPQRPGADCQETCTDAIGGGHSVDLYCRQVHGVICIYVYVYVCH